MNTHTVHKAAGLRGLSAAAYVRMSTDMQDQSIAEQLDYIDRYASSVECTVVKVYRDEGRSGLTALRRPGLQQMLADIARGSPGFELVLVYDVSRWGRFLDIDESAYYEYLCRRHGIRIVYCAEPFGQNDTPMQHLFKDLKRIMAAEHSRELSQKVFDAHAYLLTQGYKPGGAAGFGLRRLCLRADGSRRCTLEPGERKAHPTDRVVLTPGPDDEVATVRLIYSMYCREGLTCRESARRLNAQGLHAGAGKLWTDSRVRAILTNEKYCGNLVYNRISERLGGRRRLNPAVDWLRRAGAHIGIVSAVEFAEARKQRQLRQGRDVAAMLEKLREIYARRGYLCRRLTDSEPGIPHSETIKKLFGSVHQAYQAALGLDINRMPKETHQARFARRVAELRDQVWDCIQRAGHGVQLSSQRHVLVVDGALTLRISVRSICCNGGCLGWFAPARSSGTDFVLCALQTINEDRFNHYVLLSTANAAQVQRWIPAKSPERCGLWLSASLEAFFGLGAGDAEP
ncbi:recombinase family protein [Duganella sp. HH101]|uniref:recombinase family protein n=1 Tax=Duganella sp. HH101 TaxID=1781066 RepID=UPI000874839A|nr:recombinase family protein [Duganella sp. HH101]OFA00178.1 hypothetical protein DUGA2_50110 [Duganella sp. HH101]